MPPLRSGEKSPSPFSDRFFEIAGLLLLALAVFLALALWTHHPEDPSWNARVSPDWKIRNYGGTMGSYLGGGAVQLLGSFAALLPVGLFLWGLSVFAEIRVWRSGWPALGWLIAVLSAEGLFYKLFSVDPLFGKSALPGGMVGYGVSAMLGGTLGGAGSAIVLAAAFLAALTATTGLSFGQPTAFAAKGSAWVLRQAAWLSRKAGFAVGSRLLSVGKQLWMTGGDWAWAAGKGLGRKTRKIRNSPAQWEIYPEIEEPEPEFALGEGAPEGNAEKVPLRLEEDGGNLVRGRNGNDFRANAEEPWFGLRPPQSGDAVSSPAFPGPAAEEKSRNGHEGAEPGETHETGPAGEADLMVMSPPESPPRSQEVPLSAKSASPGQGNVETPAVVPPRKKQALRIGRERAGREGTKEAAKGPAPVPQPIVSAGFSETPPPPVSGPSSAADLEDVAEVERIGAEEPALQETEPNSAEGDKGRDVVVHHAGAMGEADIVRIKDEALVAEDLSRPAALRRTKKREPATCVLPPIDSLSDPPAGGIIVDEAAIRENSIILEQTLREFSVEGRVTEVKTGPVITVYEFAPAAGVKVAKIASLSDDLARALSAISVRIVAPIPGKSVVGIELPNQKRNAVYLKEIFSSREFQRADDRLTLALGKDILGRTTLTDLAKIPHLLIAGTTGSGKSVSLNMMICSLIVRCMPRELQLVMIDPKMLEFSVYEGLPHLLVPVITDSKKAASALRGLVAEMERRYLRMSKTGVRNIESYNALFARELGEKEAKRRLSRPLSEDAGGDVDDAPDFMPYIVVVIDELADLMMVSSREVEDTMIRLAQMARAAGIHLVVATQRPSVDVLTGLIKANFPSRIALRVATRTDSRTIIDANGAERLLGKGDMLFLPPGAGAAVRIHGGYVSEEEIKSLVAHWGEQGPAAYHNDFLVEKESFAEKNDALAEELDDRYDDAIALVARTREASISLIQRYLRIGYNRAARLIERMEREGIIGPSDGVKRRQVLIPEVPGNADDRAEAG